MVGKKSRKLKKKQVTLNEMVINKLQEQIKCLKNNNLAKEKKIRQLSIKEKKEIFIVGDSIIKKITGTGFSRDHTVKIRPHPGAASINMCHYIKPELRHKRDVIILHCGANNTPNERSTEKKVNKFLKEIEEYDTQNTRCHIYNAGHNIFELYKFLVPVQVATNKTKRDINQYNEFGIRVA